MNHTLFPSPIGLNGYQTILGSCSDVEKLRVSQGNLVRQYTVASIATVGPSLNFVLFHNSIDNFLGTVGINWRHSAMAKLDIGMSLVTYTDSQGRTYDYEPDGPNWKLTDDSLFLRMTLVEDGSEWKLVSFGQGDTMVFDSSGRLDRIEDSHGQTLTFSYFTSGLDSGKLQFITEPTGRFIELEYTSGLVSKIIDPRSLETTLGYLDSNLISIGSPEGCQLSYEYADPENGLITLRTDANGNEYAYEYDGSSRLTRVVGPNPDLYELNYSYDTASERTGTTDVIQYHNFARTTLHDAEGHDWDYRFDLFGNLWRILDPLNHTKRLYWGDQQQLLYISEGYSYNIDDTLGPWDNPFNRFQRNVYDSLGNLVASIDANGVITQMEYGIEEDEPNTVPDSQARLVAVTPARATLAVGGEWFDHFGKDGFLMCSALDTSDDLWQPPAYVSGPILPGETDDSDPFERALPVIPTHRLDTRAPWIRMPGDPPRDTYRRTLGQWKSQRVDDVDNTSFTFRIPIGTTGAFNLSFYTHCVEQQSIHDANTQFQQIYAANFGRDIEILVTDEDPITHDPRRQSFRMPNTAAGVWMTFGVYATAESEIRVKVRSRVATDGLYPVINCIAFDPIEDYRTTYSYTGPDLTRVTNPLGQSTEMEYNLDGTLQKVTDAKSRDTQFFYLDTNKNLTKIVDANSGESFLTYDENGNVLSSEDQDTRVTLMNYDGKNRLVLVTDPLTHATEFVFDSAGNMTQIIDALSRNTDMAYNSMNRLVKITNFQGKETLFEYNGTGRLTKITDPLSHETAFTYDAAGRRIETLLADEQKVLYAYNAVNRLVSITGPNASRSNWEEIQLTNSLNVLNNPGVELTWPSEYSPSAPSHWSYSDDVTTGPHYIRVRSNAEAHSGAYSLSADTGQKWIQKDVSTYAGGRYLAKAWAKKGSGGASTITASIAASMRDLQTDLVVQTDVSQETVVSDSWTELLPQVVEVPGDSQATRLSPPLAGLELRCAKTSPSDSASLAYFDDASLNLISTCLEYDGENLREVATPDGARFRREFDRAGRLASISDPQGRSIHFTRDGLNRVVGVRDSLGNTLGYSFDATGQLETFTDSRGQVTIFGYDLLDRLESITYEDTSTELFGYSDAGDLISYTDNLSQVRTFGYDDAHRLTQVNYPVGSETLILAYDAVGNLTQRTERNGDVEVYTYDSLYRLTRCQLTPGGGSLSRQADLTSVYDDAGNRIQLGPTAVTPALYGTALYGTGRYAQPDHYWSVPSMGGLDEMNRMLSFEDSQSNTTEMAYDVEGRRVSVAPPNGTLTEATYDIVGKLLSLRTTLSSTELLHLRYDYNLSSDRLALQSEKASYTYHLDQGGRLVQETTNRWVTEHFDHLAQGELDGCSIDAATGQVQLLGLTDDFSQLDLDRWKPLMRQWDYTGGIPAAREPYLTGSQVRADQGLHMVHPSAWSQLSYASHSHPTILNPVRDMVGYGKDWIYHDLDFRRTLTGDFDIVLEWDGFDMPDPPSTPTERGRYPRESILSMRVETLAGGSPMWISRATLRDTPNWIQWSPGYHTDSNAPSGKFRIKRDTAATSLTLYYWEDEAWVTCTPGSVTSGYTSADLRFYIVSSCYEGYFNHRLISLYHYDEDPVKYRKTSDTNPAGFYTSSIYDAGQEVTWSRIAWDETLPTNTDVGFQVAVSNSPDGPWTYRGTSGSTSTFFTTSEGESLPETSDFVGRYARFQAKLTSTDGLNTPEFGNLHLSFTGSGLLASSCRNYNYDAAGNITSIVTITDSGSTTDDRNPSAMPINNLNQIKRRVVGGVTWNYTYDLDGNLTSKTDGTNTYTYTFSDENRLTRVQGPAGLDVAYTYDTSGRMMSRTSGGVVTQFSWDAWDCVREVTGASETVYHIPDGTLQSFSINGAVYQVHMDALSSVRMITDATGAVVARLEYGAYGEEIFVSASSALTNFPYRFVGALGCRTDAAVGLVYMRNRWYDPSLQRFISRDPIGLHGGPNRYAYVGNNPARFNDPSGLQPEVNILDIPAVPRPTWKERPDLEQPDNQRWYWSGRCECPAGYVFSHWDVHFPDPNKVGPQNLLLAPNYPPVESLNILGGGLITTWVQTPKGPNIVLVPPQSQSPVVVDCYCKKSDCEENKVKGKPVVDYIFTMPTPRPDARPWA